eukprot:5919363-Pleurochrysis_carterae.AAC.2
MHTRPCEMRGGRESMRNSNEACSHKTLREHARMCVSKTVGCVYSIMCSAPINSCVLHDNERACTH